MNEQEELTHALNLLHEVYTYQYSFDIHDRIKEFLVKHGLEPHDAQN